ncbi:hypothetical protein MGG_13836 [Pyricularia oryzae 70-15]|uniref:Uncharacterized protein n=3 Tax=Pyricularia oryzae TaxID=318829 RepID=G4N0Z9_PYRO7|nr:uncharacterized protein MGG_13836 [Pyricularia oryzae 70-15]EHA53175.1 hypothetical protein MGG_13836 [Pyricularia oryzae 70-15]ELQ44336.1 hypothetical protein OOU_Y34scaffold00090g1 [Pyricularia oryzae Y34]KAI7915857.1 hypothetical protein M9X92_008184 [Pyricularia oryzae]KAI7917264.1 hypothetical protein M0657_008165 [Pyricularia oryzae]
MHTVRLFITALTTLVVVPTSVVANPPMNWGNAYGHRGNTASYNSGQAATSHEPTQEYDLEPTYLSHFTGEPEVQRLKKDCEVWLLKDNQVQETRYANYKESVKFLAIPPGPRLSVRLEWEQGGDNPCRGNVWRGEIPRGYYVSIVKPQMSPISSPYAFKLHPEPDATRCHVVFASANGANTAEAKNIDFGKKTTFIRNYFTIIAEPDYVGPYRRRTCKARVVEGDIPGGMVVRVGDAGSYGFHQTLFPRGVSKP